MQVKENDGWRLCAEGSVNVSMPLVDRCGKKCAAFAPQSHYKYWSPPLSVEQRGSTGITRRKDTAGFFQRWLTVAGLRNW